MKISEHFRQPDLFRMDCPSQRSSVADSLVRIYPLPAKEQASQVYAADCGKNMPGLLARYCHDSLSWRTRQLCLDGELARFSGIWPRSGTVVNGIAYQLVPLVPGTKETESGSLPGQMWPTSTATSGDYYSNGRLKLPGAARMYPTPMARDYRYGMKLKTVDQRAKRSSRGVNLSEHIQRIDRNNGRLNPKWVEWLMGFPTDWTEAIPTRAQRIQALGNAVIPQLPELIGEAIIEFSSLKTGQKYN